MAVEWNDNAVQTYQANFPDTPVYHGDITKLSVEEVCRLAEVELGQLDILDGSPPCQGFSTAGRRDFNDDRNQLFREYVRLLRGLRPKVFVMENVSGMVKGKMKLIFAECLQELKASGYKVKARLLNAMYYGVPQSRQRLIFIGVRDDLGKEPSHPEAQTTVQTIREAMVGCPIDESERNWLLTEGQRHASYAMWSSLKPGQNTRFGDHVRLDVNKPSRSIVKFAANVGARSSMHWNEQRRPTTREYARIASFPDTFKFIGGFKCAVERIGNTVPPLFMKAIAEHIRDNILATGNTDGDKTGK